MEGTGEIKYGADQNRSYCRAAVVVTTRARGMGPQQKNHWWLDTTQMDLREMEWFRLEWSGSG
jgi:hypothetical protein